MLKIIVVTCAIALCILARDVATGPNQPYVETWVEIAARNISQQSKLRSVKWKILGDIDRQRAMILGPYYDLEKLINSTKLHLMDIGMRQIDAEEKLYPCRPEKYVVHDGLRNISWTESCVNDIVVGRIYVRSHVDVERFIQVHRALDEIYEYMDNCGRQRNTTCFNFYVDQALNITESIPGWPVYDLTKEFVYPNDYEESVNECVKIYNFYSITDYVLPQIDTIRRCMEKLIEDHPTWSQRLSGLFS